MYEPAEKASKPPTAWTFVVCHDDSAEPGIEIKEGPVGIAR
jgi:hypothetical protein